MQPSPAVRKLVVIEEGTIASMANSAAFLTEFPFLSQLKSAPPRSGCGGCGGQGVNAARAGTIAQLKQTLVGMGDDRKRRLKQMLNAKQVRITVRSGNRIVQHTF